MKLHLGLAIALLVICAAVQWRELQDFPPLNSEIVSALPIDGPGYLKGAGWMIDHGNWIYTSNSFHSIGMQILTAALVRIYGSLSPVPIYIWNALVWLAILTMFAYAIYRLTQRPIYLWLGPLILLGSASLSEYIALVQYEITVAAICLGLGILQMGSGSRNRQIASGALVAVLGIFRVHFSLMLCLLLLRRQYSPMTSPVRARMMLILGFALIAVPFNVFYGYKLKQVFYFQNNVNQKVLFGNLNPASSGLLFPYSPSSYPKGLSYVITQPKGYLKLLARRAGYLTGITPDIWFVESYWTKALAWLFRMGTVAARSLFISLALALVLLGMIRLSGLRGSAIFFPWAFLFPFIVVVFPNLLINSAARMLVPSLPCLILLQVLGLDYLSRQLSPRPLLPA